MLRYSPVFLILLSLFTAQIEHAQIKEAEKQASPAASSTPTASCGVGLYCAESSRQFKAESPIAPPKVNQVFRDPDFGSRMVRVTDETGIDGKLMGFSFASNSSAEINEWGKFNPSLGPNGGYYFYVMTGGGGAVPYSMDAVTMQVTPHCGALPSCRLPTGGSFSYVDPNIIYGHFDSNGAINAYNIATGKQTTIYDFSKCPNLPGDVSGYAGALANSGDDSKFSSYPGGKQQGFGTLVTFYDRTTDHCYWYDTGTGRLGGSGMTAFQLKMGLLAPPPAPQLSRAEGSLPAGDYYVQVTATRARPDSGETLPSPEAHIHLDGPSGIAVAAPEFDNPYGLPVEGYNVYIGTASGQEMRQSSGIQARTPYVQSAALAKGAAPPKTSTAGYTVHNARLSRDGRFVKIIPQNTQVIYFWMPGTTTVTACSSNGKGKAPDVASFCGGHTVLGFSHLLNPGGEGSGTSLLIRPLSDLNNFTQRMTPEITVPRSMDVHWSWNNVDPSDSAPVCGAYSRSNHTVQGNGSRDASNPIIKVDQAWDREIVCVATSGPPKVWRFAHHRATGACNANARGGSCFNTIAIGNVSQDGKFFLFGSDWDWQLGSDSRNPGCPNSGRCRADTFIVELK
jgi:hypothetical protein